MKTIYTSLLILLFSINFFGCDDFDTDCIADIAVTALDAPAAVINGNPIEVICVIKNIVNTASSCTSSGEGTVTVTCAYNEGFSDQFSDYDVFEKRTTDIDSYNKGEGQQDLMTMPTDQGPGYYAMQVEVDYPNDSKSENDGKAVAIRVD